MEPVKLLTFRQVASFYSVTRRTVERWAEKGAIAVVRTPTGTPRVPATECVRPTEKHDNRRQ